MLYRPFFRETLRLTWERKSLWIFGIFAGLISTGGVIDVAVVSLQKVEKTQSLLSRFADASFIGYDLAASYIEQITRLGPQTVTILVIASTLAVLLIMVIATLSQGALLLGIRSKNALDPYTLRREAVKHFWPLLCIGLLNKIVTGVIITILTLPLWLISVSNASQHAVFFFTLTTLLIPLLIIVNIVYMFAMIDLVEKRAHPIDAIVSGIRLFSKQWLATFEYGLLLFFIIFGAGLLALAALMLLIVPYTFLFTAILLTGSLPLFLASHVLLGLLAIGILLAIGGAFVTYQYSAWYLFYRRGLHKVHGGRPFSKILRLAYR